MYLALTALYSLFGLVVTWLIVTAPEYRLRFDVAAPVFDDVPDMTYDSRGMT